MATTHIHAIKSTLKKAIDYIVNPEKTDASMLVSTFGCSVEFADLEMQATASKGSGQGNRVAYHFYQSFAKDDPVTPELAHSIAEEFAEKYLKGKYEYVLATHIDKDHIHNHIIFNSVNMENFKKYRYSGDAERDKIRAISDKLCIENGLSVIESTTGRRGWKRGDKQVSEKQKLMDTIDLVLTKVSSFEEFLTVMELEYHYDIKSRGSMISLKPEGCDKYIRLKASTLGENYTEDMIRKRIENPDLVPTPKINKPQNVKNEKSDIWKNRRKKINLIVDISKNIKAQESKGYEIVLQRSNTENLVKTMNFLIDNNITTPEKFIAHASKIRGDYEQLRSKKKEADDKARTMLEKIKYVQLYNKYKPLFLAYKRSENKNEFHAKYAKEISLYRASLIYFEREQIEHPEKIVFAELLQERKELKTEIFQINRDFNIAKERVYELNIIQKNIETTLDIKLSDSVENERTTERRNEEISK